MFLAVTQLLNENSPLMVSTLCDIHTLSCKNTLQEFDQHNFSQQCPSNRAMETELKFQSAALALATGI